MVNDQLSRQPPVDEVKSREKDIGPFFGNSCVFSFNKSNSFKELTYYKDQDIVTTFIQWQRKEKIKRQRKERYGQRLNLL